MHFRPMHASEFSWEVATWKSNFLSFFSQEKSFKKISICLRLSLWENLLSQWSLGNFWSVNILKADTQQVLGNLRKKYQGFVKIWRMPTFLAQILKNASNSYRFSRVSSALCVKCKFSEYLTAGKPETLTESVKRGGGKTSSQYTNLSKNYFYG